MKKLATKVQIIDSVQLYRNTRLKRHIALNPEYAKELWGGGQIVLTDELLEALEVEEGAQLLIFLRPDGWPCIGVLERN